jgi:hypothetical protein
MALIVVSGALANKPGSGEAAWTRLAPPAPSIGQSTSPTSRMSPNASAFSLARRSLPKAMMEKAPD